MSEPGHLHRAIKGTGAAITFPGIQKSGSNVSLRQEVTHAAETDSVIEILDNIPTNTYVLFNDYPDELPICVQYRAATVPALNRRGQSKLVALIVPATRCADVASGYARFHGEGGVMRMTDYAYFLAYLDLSVPKFNEGANCFGLDWPLVYMEQSKITTSVHCRYFCHGIFPLIKLLVCF